MTIVTVNKPMNKIAATTLPAITPPSGDFLELDVVMIQFSSLPNGTHCELLLQTYWKSAASVTPFRQLTVHTELNALPLQLTLTEYGGAKVSHII